MFKVIYLASPDATTSNSIVVKQKYDRDSVILTLIEQGALIMSAAWRN